MARDRQYRRTPTCVFCGRELSPLRRLLNQHFCSKAHEIENTRQLNMAALSRLASAVVDRKPLAHATDTFVNREVRDATG